MIVRVFNILNIIENDLSDIFNHMVKGTLNKINISIKNKCNIVKYLVPQGYPNNPNKCVINYINKKTLIVQVLVKKMIHINC